MRPSERMPILAALLLAALPLATPLAADEGMWMPQQIPDLADEAAGDRLRGRPRRPSPTSPASRWARSSRSAAARPRSSRPTA